MYRQNNNSLFHSRSSRSTNSRRTRNTKTIRSKKGQAALEYLTTYGWGFVVILTTIGALSYFGFFSPEKYVPEKCYFGTQLICEDYYVTGNSISLYLRNDFGKDIRIINASVEDYMNSKLDPPGTSTYVEIPNGETQEIMIDGADMGLAGEKQSYILVVEFAKNESTVTPGVQGPMHKLVGSLHATIQT